ncbi:MAG: glycosyltransferase family 4 protein [Bacteroidales bacterium]|nr:glycosyltransferase family 4 protein [Bacteroidales bacterium]
MKIGFDAKRAVQNFTGLGNYSRYVIEALLHFDDKNSYDTYSPKRVVSKQFSNITNSYNNITEHYPNTWFGRKFPTFWRTWNIWHDIDADNIDIYHGLSNELPLSIKHCQHTKSVLTMHDLIYLRLPQCYTFLDRKLYNFKYKRSCKNADLIIAVSECTKRDIVELYGIDAKKIEVIYQGCDPSFAQKSSDEKKAEVKHLYNLPDKYVLSVGSIEERKNALSLVKTLPLLPTDIHIVLVGKHTKYTNRIIEWAEKNSLSQRLHILNKVSFVDLPTVYQMCQTFVYPSVYEGFGIPIVEALNSQVPVVAATGSCLEEAGGPNSIYVAPNDVDAIYRAITQTFDVSTRNKMIEAGIEWAKRFSQKELAAQTIACYQRLLTQQ